MSMGDQSDDRLQEELRRALERAEPEDAAALELARAAYDWRTLDAELVEVVADSADQAVAGMRTEDAPRLASFAGASLAVELEIEAHGAACRVTGHVLPPGEAEVRVTPARGEQIVVAADELGVFAADDLPRGPTRLTVRSAAGHEVETAWLVL